MATRSTGTKITGLTTSYQTCFEAESPWSSGSAGYKPVRSLVVRGVGNGIIVQASIKLLTGDTADVRLCYGADGQDVIVTCADEAGERIVKCEVKGESAAGNAYTNILIHDGSF